jgi:anthranilate/para-aminobenzoate synthase component I
VALRLGLACSGAVGAFEADGPTRFNVAIRTIVLRKPPPAEGTCTHALSGVLGIGGGIVQDSDPTLE